MFEATFCPSSGVSHAPEDGQKVAQNMLSWFWRSINCYRCICWSSILFTYTMFFIIISALHVLGGISAHHQELIKLYVQPWVLSCFRAVYRWCGWVGTVQLMLLECRHTTQGCTYSFISSWWWAEISPETC